MRDKEKKGRILVVDDEISIRQFLEIMLRREKYEVITVNSAKACLKELNKRNFDIVLTDINMPEMDGLELLKKIKQENAETVVVIMTAYGSAESAVIAMKRGASDYISKPFQIEELLLVLNKCLHTAQLEDENKLLEKQSEKGIFIRRNHWHF